MSYTLLTSRPGKEIDPSLSPDGASVAYAMSPDSPGRPTAIFVQSSQPTPARQLTAPPPGAADRMPRWSPDGRQVMFVREDRQEGCELRLLPATGGMERVVGRCDRFSGGRYDWLPDGSGIVAGLRAESDGKPAPLSILRLDSGQWAPMRYPIAPGNVDFDPRFSPDGSRLGFRRNLVRSEIWVMPVQGGTPVQLTRLRALIDGWDWAADGRSLLLGMDNGVPKLVRHDLETGRTTTIGHFPASSLDAAPRGGNLVFALATSSTAMFRYPLPLREAAEPQPLFASTGTDELPSPSPDGRTIAFYSTRSHEARVWIGEPDHPDRLRMIDGIVPTRMHPPIWSPDGNRLLVVGDPAGDGGPQGPLLFEIEVASGRSSQVALEGAPYFAQSLPGHRMLALTDLGSGKSSLLVIDRAPPGRVLARLDDVGEARFDPGSGQVYFVRIGTPGLWRAGLDLAAPTLLDERWPIVYWHMWALLDGKALALRSVPACPAEWYWIGPAPGARTGCLDRTRGSDPAMETMPSQDGRWLYASMSTAPASTDIGLLELGRAR
jgi:Tol biopolymer transport system component